LPRKRAAVVVALGAALAVGALGGGAFWLLHSGDDESDALHATTRRVRASEAAGEDADGADLAARGATRARLEDAASAAASGLPPCEVGPADGFRVRAVDAADRHALADARIYVVPFVRRSTPVPAGLFEDSQPGGVAFDLVRRCFEDPTRLVAAGARCFLAGPDGVARIVWPPGGALVVGFSGDQRGAGVLAAGDDATFELPFTRGTDLIVEVVAKDGAPVAGAQVVIGMRNEAQPFPKGGVSPWHAGATTDARGLARLAGFELVAASFAQRRPSDVGALGVFVPYLGSAERCAFLELPDPQHVRGRLRIVLDEPFGALEVRVADARGARSTADEAFATTRDFEGMRWVGMFWQRIWERPGRLLEGGVARLRPVALDRRFDVEVVTATGERSLARKDVVGPRKDGEVVRVDFDARSESRRVRGRLVGLAAAPGADTRLVATPWLKGKLPRGAVRSGSTSGGPDREAMPAASIAARVVGDGVFEIDATAVRSERLASIALRGFDRAHDAGFEATIPFEDELSAPVTDVGDVPVKVLPILVSGRVRDDLGRPVARVALAVRESAEDPRLPRKFDGKSRIDELDDADGTFTLLEDVEFESPVLYLGPPSGFAPQNVPFERGTRGLDCVLQRTGTIAGTVVSDLAVAIFAHLQSTPVETSVSAAFQWRESAARDGEGRELPRPFSFELRPGRWEVFATTSPNQPQTSVVARVPDVEVRAGDTTLDPRLNPMQIRAQLVSWRIVLARSDGAPPPSAWVRLAPADAPESPWRTVYVANGEARFEAALDSAWVDVDATSFRRVHELHARGDVAISLEPLEQREVELSLAVADVPHVYDLHWFVAAERTPPLPEFQRDAYTTTVMPGGSASLRLDEGERWTLKLYAQIDAGGAPRRVELSRCAQEVSTRGAASETPEKLSFVVHSDEVDAFWQELSSSK
jgi:hypothetical protein